MGAVAAIEVQQLSFAYGARAVLQTVSLQVASGGVTVLLGRNGSGKSTLLRLMAGMLPLQRGQVRVLGEDLTNLSARQRARRVGFLPQQHRPVFPFTLEQVVLTGRAAHVGLWPAAADRRQADAAIERTGIAHLRGRIFTELSGGEQQLAMIARVLAQQPRIMLLDEPTAHLDVFHQARLLGLVRDLAADGLTVVIVLHDPSSAFRCGDAFLFLKAGRLLAPEPGQPPWETRFLETVFDAPLEVIPYHDRALVVPLASAGGIHPPDQDGR
jgi:iron complex transport system ATP-binding protein